MRSCRWTSRNPPIAAAGRGGIFGPTEIDRRWIVAEGCDPLDPPPPPVHSMNSRRAASPASSSSRIRCAVSATVFLRDPAERVHHPARIGQARRAARSQTKSVCKSLSGIRVGCAGTDLAARSRTMVRRDIIPLYTAPLPLEGSTPRRRRDLPRQRSRGEFVSRRLPVSVMRTVSSMTPVPRSSTTTIGS